MMTVARCQLPNRPVPARHTAVPGGAVGLRALQAIVTRAALFCPCGQAALVPPESVSPFGYSVGGVGTVRHALASTSLIH